MKATYFCNDCETTVEIDAKELLESVSCPNCNAAMEESQMLIEDLHLDRIEKKVRETVATRLTILFVEAGEKLGDSPKVQRRIVRSLNRAVLSAMKNWKDLRLEAIFPSKGA
ncbi:MAG: hypothetical protein V3U60_16150 [Gammaproteobacteria bacterium]